MKQAPGEARSEEELVLATNDLIPKLVSLSSRVSKLFGLRITSIARMATLTIGD